MADPFDYQSAIRNRLILLIGKIDPAGVRFRPGTTETAGDTSKSGVRGRTAAKVTPNYFPVVEVFDGRTTDDMYANVETVGLNDRDGQLFPNEIVPVTQEMFVRVTHANENQTRNAAEDRLIAEALRAGGRQLANPDVPDSELQFVNAWGPLTWDRPAPRWIKKDIRRVSLGTLSVVCDVTLSELAGVAAAPMGVARRGVREPVYEA
jgi:hypothetical protein